MTPEGTGATETGDGGAGRGLDDDAINRLVAERVMGWQRCDCDQHCGFWYEGDTMYPLPNVTTDPAAWGALFEHLRAIGQQPHIWTSGPASCARVGKTKRVWRTVSDLLTGRALALAALRAYGVEVQE